MREWDPDNLINIMQVMKRPWEHKCSEIKFSFQFLNLSFLLEVFVLFFLNLKTYVNPLKYVLW
jgi:hypothetical protein